MIGRLLNGWVGREIGRPPNVKVPNVHVGRWARRRLLKVRVGRVIGRLVNGQVQWVIGRLPNGRVQWVIGRQPNGHVGRGSRRLLKANVRVGRWFWMPPGVWVGWGCHCPARYKVAKNL